MPRTASRLLWGLPVAAMLMGLAAALWPAAEPAVTANAAEPAQVGATALQPGSTPPATATAPPAATLAAEDPMHGLSAEERVALASALAGHPARDAEMRRVAGFLRLQRQVQAWREARASRPDAAARIEAALPAALAARSVSAGEALQLQAQLIAAREPDAARADAELAAWRTRHVVASVGPGPREREFLAQQQALVAAYQGKPEKLEPALEALRLKHFAATN